MAASGFVLACKLFSPVFSATKHVAPVCDKWSRATLRAVTLRRGVLYERRKKKETPDTSPAVRSSIA